MTTYVMVHGSWHGAWCWEKVAPLLRAHGHDVVAVDLPGHGERRSATTPQTLKTYSETVIDAVTAAQKPVVLVAHRMAGVVATQAAETVPGNIARIVYVCAYVPTNGQSLLDLAKGDADSRIF